jgi:pyruvate formate lyase activating enzyme
MKVKIGGIIGFSTLDYPGRPSAVVFMGGCPFRCPFCYNYEFLAAGDSCKDLEPLDVLRIIKDNRRMVDAIVFTGGEPLEQLEGLSEMLRLAKKENLLTKLDTNGFYPERLQSVLELLDYVAIDVKTRLEPDAYSKAIGKPIGERAILNLRKSIQLMKSTGINLELRTTVVPGLISERDVQEICKELKPKKYFLQQFLPDKTLDPAYSKVRMTLDEELVRLAKVARENGAEEVWIRGGTLVRT